MGKVLLWPVLLLLCLSAARMAPTAGARDVRGTLANGWIAYAIDGPASDAEVTQIIPDPTQGVIALGTSKDQHLLWASADGRQWQRVDGDPFAYLLAHHVEDLSTNLFDIVGSPVFTGGHVAAYKAIGPDGGYIAVGYLDPLPDSPDGRQAAVWLSRDRQTWQLLPNPNGVFSNAQIQDVTRTGSGWVAVGLTDWQDPPVHPAVWLSADAVHWTRAPNQAAFGRNSSMKSVLSSSHRLLAMGTTEIGAPAYQTVTWTSSDGITWRQMPGDPFAGGLATGVTLAGDTYVAVGSQDDDPAVWSSTDGLHWTRAAGALTFPGSSTVLRSVTSIGGAVVIIGRRDVAETDLVPTAWVWTRTDSEASPTPIARPAALDPKSFRLRLTDMPAGYKWATSGYLDLCTGEAGGCGPVKKALGAATTYFFVYVSTSLVSGPPGQISGMAIVGNQRGAQALMKVGSAFVQWWGQGGTVRSLVTRARIGQQTELYVCHWKTEGMKVTGYVVNWRDGAAVGQVLAAQVDGKRSTVSAAQAIALARVQWRRYRTEKANT